MLSGLSLLGLVRDDIGAELCVIAHGSPPFILPKRREFVQEHRCGVYLIGKDLIRIVQMKSMEFAIPTPSGRCLATVLSA